MRNTPVLLTTGNTQQIVIFNPERLEDDAWMYGGQCTGAAKSRRGARCGNITWDEGQVAGYRNAYVGDLVVPVLGPMPGDANHRYTEQRCRVHDTPDAAAYCDPEWVRFDPDRHGPTFGRAPRYFDVFSADDRHSPPVPPINILAAALRDHFTVPELEQLARLLTERDPRPGQQ